MNLLEINNFFATTLNNFVINNNLEKCIWLFSDAPIFLLPIFLVISRLYYTFKEKNNSKKSDLLNIFFTTILAIIISSIIQQIITIDRPESIITPILQHIPDASFPSDHASVSFAFLFWILFAGYKKIFYIFLVPTIIMNFSRIAWWIHWFFDIIAGFMVWIIASIIIFKYFKYTKISMNINNFIIKILNYIKL